MLQVHINWKILLVIAAVCMAIGYSVTLLFSPKESSVSTSAIPVPTPTPSPVAWKTYTGSDFQISYPQSLILTSSTIQGGGTELIFESNTPVPRYIVVQAIPASAANTESIAGFFKARGYIESATTLDGYIARKFTGTVGVESTKAQEIVILFENRGKMYKAQLKYESKNSQREIEDEFNRMVDSFHL